MRWPSRPAVPWAPPRRPRGVVGLLVGAPWPACALAAVLAAVASDASPAVAQEDFRNLDHGRPLLTEDAYPVKLREWEAALGLRGLLREGGTGTGGTLTGELKTGLFRDSEVGVELEVTVRDAGDGSEAGLEAVGAHLQHVFSRETWNWSAFAARLELESPGVGEGRREDWGAGVTGIATRSLDRLRLHANAGYRVASRADGDDAWIGGLAVDYPVGLFSRLVMADLFVEVPVEAGRTRVWLEAGTRWQVTNLSVLDLGLATRLDEWEAGRANVELVFGLSRAFGVPALVDVPAYRDPMIQ